MDEATHSRSADLTSYLVHAVCATREQLQSYGIEYCVEVQDIAVQNALTDTHSLVKTSQTDTLR